VTVTETVPTGMTLCPWRGRVDVPGGRDDLHAQRLAEWWGGLPGDHGDGKRGVECGDAADELGVGVWGWVAGATANDPTTINVATPTVNSITPGSLAASLSST